MFPSDGLPSQFSSHSAAYRRDRTSGPPNGSTPMNPGERPRHRERSPANRPGKSAGRRPQMCLDVAGIRPEDAGSSERSRNFSWTPRLLRAAMQNSSRLAPPSPPVLGPATGPRRPGCARARRRLRSGSHRRCDERRLERPRQRYRTRPHAVRRLNELGPLSTMARWQRSDLVARSHAPAYHQPPYRRRPTRPSHRGSVVPGPRTLRNRPPTRSSSEQEAD